MIPSIAHTIKRMLPAGTNNPRVYRSGPGTQVALARDHVARGRTVVLLLPSGTDHNLYAALADLLTPGDRGKPFWERSWISFPAFPPGSEDAKAWAARWAALFSLTEPVRGRGILLPVGNLFSKWPSRRVVQEEHFYLIPGEELAPETVLDRLTAWGYERVSMVGRVGEMALRGDILDICCPGYRHPLRIEFFGDTVEGVRLFEPLSQRSIENLDQAVIVPVSPSPGKAPYTDQAEKLWAGLSRTGELSESARASLQQKLREGALIPPGLFYEDARGIGEWLPEDTLYLMVDANDLRPRMEEVEWGWKGYFQEHCPGWPRQGVIQTMGDARETWAEAEQILFENLVIGQDRDGVPLSEKSIEGFEDLFWEPEKRNKPWRALMQELKEWRRTRHQVLLCFHSDQSRRKFLKIAEQEQHEFFQTYDPNQRGVFALVAPLNRGMDLQWAGVLILPENVLQPKAAKVGAVRDADRKFVGLKRFDDLAPDDLLVHRDHGLCRFGGLHRLKVGDVANDYLLLLFARDDKLYLPVDRLGLVQRYNGPEGGAPALDRLGGAGWQKTRSRVRKAIEKIAQDLVAMYAYRKVAKRFSYKPIPRDYWEFEAGFGFEETPDQDKAIREVLKDMERSEPMDRLVCGDVGFGKTEVAMRAAFRAVLDGRQVALLCPTTVLAEQHYRNFRRRMEEEFSVRVGLLSRFVPRKTQKLLLEATARGEVDILIGTHRLLSADVHMPNLALLILDEEQRFGVKHKEQLKRMRKDIDVLTLTATPIPRTLQLSLSGIRGLSVIETAPVDRKPVQTSLMERDPEVLRSILKRELDRGGQVFWVYNRVQGLEQVRD
ncbi:MAG TPA: DEAD/DEAH box helicase, partial [Desulfomicrobiaceae bacterium]|nr:DEAD/DEAH box helicase [Desulfomicrobiaceae bacterium]